MKRKRAAKDTVGHHSNGSLNPQLVAFLNSLSPTQMQNIAKTAQVVPADEAEIDVKDLKVLDPDRMSEADVEVFSKIAIGTGHPEFAAYLKGEVWEDSWSNKMTKFNSQPITRGTVLKLAVGAGVLWLVYEAIAVRFDLPNMGVFAGKSRR
jgi:hypothetical protein